MGQVVGDLRDTLANTVECNDCKDPHNHSSGSAWGGGGEEAECGTKGSASITLEEDSASAAFDAEVAACVTQTNALLPAGLRLVVLGGVPDRDMDEDRAKLIRKLVRRLLVTLPGQLVVLTSGKPGVQTALATGLGDSPSLVDLVPDDATLSAIGARGRPQRHVKCGATAQLCDAALVQLGQAFLVFEGDADATSRTLAEARPGALIIPIHRADELPQLRVDWVTVPEWACLSERSPNVVCAGVMAILIKAARREKVGCGRGLSARSSPEDKRLSSPILTCLDPEHVRFQAGLLAPEEAAHLQSHEFLDSCHRIFHSFDDNSSGFLEAGHGEGEIGEAVRGVLPSVFRDRFAAMAAQDYALSFDKDWDGKVNFDEFVSFCQWAAMMHSRGLFVAQAQLHAIGAGQGERLLIVSNYLDPQSTLHAAVKANVDVARYSPSGVTAVELAQRIAAAQRLRAKAGLPPYRSVAIANHGTDPEGTWQPFAGIARKLTVAADVEYLVPVFVELASLLAKDGGRLDILACSLASAPGGMSLLKRLEEETGQRVCASKDATGNVEQGGNWVMEVGGNVNVAPDYFDDARLRDFDRLMRLKLKPKKKLHGHKEPPPHSVKPNAKRRISDRLRDHQDSSTSDSD